MSNARAIGSLLQNLRQEASSSTTNKRPNDAKVVPASKPKHIKANYGRPAEPSHANSTRAIGSLLQNLRQEASTTAATNKRLNDAPKSIPKHVRARDARPAKAMDVKSTDKSGTKRPSQVDKSSGYATNPLAEKGEVAHPKAMGSLLKMMHTDKNRYYEKPSNRKSEVKIFTPAYYDLFEDGSPVKKVKKMAGSRDDLFCSLCNISCTSQIVLDTHLAGKKHTKNVEKLKGATNAFPGSERPATDQRTGHPRGRVADIQQKFDEMVLDESFIGLDYVTEYQRRDSQHRYFCELCGVKSNSDEMVEHVTSRQHRLRYMRTHCFDIYYKITGYPDFKNIMLPSDADKLLKQHSAFVIRVLQKCKIRLCKVSRYTCEDGMRIDFKKVDRNGVHPSQHRDLLKAEKLLKEGEVQEKEEKAKRQKELQEKKKRESMRRSMLNPYKHNLYGDSYFAAGHNASMKQGPDLLEVKQLEAEVMQSRLRAERLHELNEQGSRIVNALKKLRESCHGQQITPQESVAGRKLNMLLQSIRAEKKRYLLMGKQKHKDPLDYEEVDIEDPSVSQRHGARNPNMPRASPLIADNSNNAPMRNSQGTPRPNPPRGHRVTDNLGFRQVQDDPFLQSGVDNTLRKDSTIKEFPAMNHPRPNPPQGHRVTDDLGFCQVPDDSFVQSGFDNAPRKDSTIKEFPSMNRPMRAGPGPSRSMKTPLLPNPQMGMHRQTLENSYDDVQPEDMFDNITGNISEIRKAVEPIIEKTRQQVEEKIFQALGGGNLSSLMDIFKGNPELQETLKQWEKTQSTEPVVPHSNPRDESDYHQPNPRSRPGDTNNFQGTPRPNPHRGHVRGNDDLGFRQLQDDSFLQSGFDNALRKDSTIKEFPAMDCPMRSGPPVQKRPLLADPHELKRPMRTAAKAMSTSFNLTNVPSDNDYAEETAWADGYDEEYDHPRSTNYFLERTHMPKRPMRSAPGHAMPSTSHNLTHRGSGNDTFGEDAAWSGDYSEQSEFDGYSDSVYYGDNERRASRPGDSAVKHSSGILGSIGRGRGELNLRLLSDSETPRVMTTSGLLGSRPQFSGGSSKFGSEFF